MFVATVPSSDVVISFGRRVTVECLSTISKVGKPSSTVLISQVTGVVPVDFVLKKTSIDVIHAPSGPTRNDCANGSRFLRLTLLLLLLLVLILLRVLRILLLLFLVRRPILRILRLILTRLLLGEGAGGAGGAGGGGGGGGGTETLRLIVDRLVIVVVSRVVTLISV